MLPAMVAMAPSSTLTFEDRSEVRGRTTDPNNKIASDAETDPTLKYTALWRNGTDVFTIFYNPRFLYLDIAGGAHDLEALQGAGAAIGFYHGRTSFQLGTVGQYGTIASSSLIMPERWKGEGAPKTYYSLPQPPQVATADRTSRNYYVPRLTYVASYSNATLVHQLSRRWSLTINAQYGVFGGPTQAARKDLPLVWGPTLEAKLEHNYTRTDDIDLTAGVHYSETHIADSEANTVTNADKSTTTVDAIALQPKPAIVGYGEVRLRHKWSKSTVTELGVGAAIASQSFPDAYKVAPTVTACTPVAGGPLNCPPTPLFDKNPYASRPATIPYPTGELLTVYGKEREHGKIQLVGVARVVPWFDPFSGVNEERSEFAVAANWIWGKNGVRFQTSVYHTLPSTTTPGNYTLAIGELAYERRVSKTVGFDCGLRFEGQTFVEEEVNVTTQSTTLGTTTTKAPQSVEIARNHESFVEGVAFIGLSWLPTPLKL